VPKNSAVRILSSPRSSPLDGDGKEIGNVILRGLPRQECIHILPFLEFVRLKLHQVLHETGETIKSVYFLNEGLGSVLTTQPDGKTVEVGLIGREGFVGSAVLFGFKSSGLRVIAQSDGTAYRLDARNLLSILPECPDLKDKLLRFSMILSMQSTQLAACNRLHNVVERLARWLLMSHDRLSAETLPLTQEFLGHMLGSRRASVTVAAGILQKAGIIEYSRGSVTILNRPKLLEASCNCYSVIERRKEVWLEESQ
jgi:CRP-like cAMP-binding protein